MDDKESMKVLTEIRDELKEINSHMAFLREQANEAMENEDNKAVEVAELENRRAKKERLFTIGLLTFLGLGILLQELGYL
ncbi:TPA: hypothetical protein ACPVX7_004773 [Vibrio parahaemolyticus]|uniref:hypothetical protein n=1 Tax=Vibrio parahaemolyticus TaxID=670 RepID=UPI000414F23D|nr:hypothetical protein [Vibrio parahaemolyticus]EGR1753090.1 hypothetical protein [Vibrio parahaemolyticus]EME0905661.1 hypothetical protein [Vibrio parahaemolyticus]MDF4667173.1 hypothetical protein [Vibrio parahaemolyticus]HCG5564107.1 hypothetical protein [Vibrio parahaemolyticus]HCG8839003.1 hypothetical protein [Vibrio parahaemolyticus]